jgi:hypothetical protein
VKSHTRWFRANKLALNFEKTNFIEFVSKYKTYPSLNISSEDKLIEEVETKKNSLAYKLTIP